MTSACWARHYGDGLLAQLESEANEGWPEPPPQVQPDPVKVVVLRRLLAVLHELLAEDRARAASARCRARGKGHRLAP
jgi:hypothetical protein